tara:strand:+ start:339 stop:557 length:219 start_codon:yes stop_codon:yes gene_type:complete
MVPNKKKERSIINRLDWVKLGIFELTSRIEDIQLQVKQYRMPPNAVENIDDLFLTLKALVREAKKLKELADG